MRTAKSAPTTVGQGRYGGVHTMRRRTPVGDDKRRRWTAPFRARNYRSVAGIAKTFPQPLEGLRRYVTTTGVYPWQPELRTPIGRVRVTLPTPHDVRTANEVFCRGDYGMGTPRVVVDIGANIGVATLFFLTRRVDSVVYAYEPVPANLTVLRANLEPFTNRYHLAEMAVAVHGGPAEFLTEPVGRYGGLSEFKEQLPGHSAITVECEAMEAVLDRVIALEGHIDLVKIDTEGSEPDLVAAIPDRLWPLIGRVVWESNAGTVLTRSGDARLEV